MFIRLFLVLFCIFLVFQIKNKKSYTGRGRVGAVDILLTRIWDQQRQVLQTGQLDD